MLKTPQSKSPRHGFVFQSLPTVGGGAYPNVCGRTRPEIDYGLILDSVFEMADAITTCNGVTPEHAVAQVLRDEGWRILPTHRAAIVRRLSQA